MKIEGGYYFYSDKKNKDLSDTNYIRFYVDNEHCFDVQFLNGELQVRGSSAIKITLEGGSNCINVAIDKLDE